MLFVVPDSPASKDGKLKCGDRLLAVDGHSLECVPHSSAVTMLKQVNTLLELSTNICEVSQCLHAEGLLLVEIRMLVHKHHKWWAALRIYANG